MAVAGPNGEDAVDIDLEGDGDLGCTRWRGGDAAHLEAAKHVILGDLGTFALEDLHEHLALVVDGRGEHLLRAGGDGGVPGDQGGHDAAGGLQAERQRGDVQQHE
eukprot:scaffold432241_cov37-Prasinocladus_malaysianus.AAC.1